MKNFIKKYPDCLRQAFISLESGEVDQYFDKVLLSLQKKVQFSGYRAGKVPLEIIEKNFYNDLIQNMIYAMVTDAISDFHKQGITISTEPNFNPLSAINKNQAFSFSLIFNVAPIIHKNADLESLSLDYEEYFFDDAMLLESVKENLKSFESVEGKIEDGDTITVKIIKIEEKDAKEVVFESKIVKKLIGHKKGEKVELLFEDLGAYVTEFLNYDIQQILVEIIKIERPAIQEITDELIQQITVFKTAEEYKEYLKKRYDSNLFDKNQVSKIIALKNYINKSCEVEFSREMFENNAHERVKDFISSQFHEHEKGIKDLLIEHKEDFAALPDKIYQDLIFYIIVKDYARNNKIEAEQGLVDSIANRYAKEEKISLDDYKKKSTKDEWDIIIEKANFEKAVNVVLSKITFKSKTKKPLIKFK